MKTYNCNHCGALVFFESVTCLRCGHALGFLPDLMTLATLEAADNGQWKSLHPQSQGKLYHTCTNGKYFGVCNWLIPAEDSSSYCAACQLNLIVPDTSAPQNRDLWHKIEIAKRRLIYFLRRLQLPTEGDPKSGRPPLRFRFLADQPGCAPVLTGHENGVITLNLAEADDAEREQRRMQLHEPQRTLVGHFRHEVGHYIWDALIAGTDQHDAFRQLFGDEQRDYNAALQAYYANGPATDWPNRCVSAYASSHPWEDWAETWAHYVQMTDTVETAAAFGMSMDASLTNIEDLASQPHEVVNNHVPFDEVMKHWLPLSFALNSLNRGVGLPDLYPFVLSNTSIQKLRFIHDLVVSTGGGVVKPSPPVAVQQS